MYPLLLNAPIKDYIWGGNRLRDENGFESEKNKIAEAWVLSCHKDGESVVSNGDSFVIRPSETEPKIKIYTSVTESNMEKSCQKTNILKEKIMNAFFN